MMKAIMCAAVTAAASAAYGQGAIRITEWMYDGSGGEFVEFTNVGNAPVDMTGWSFDDDSRLPGQFLLSDFGVVLPGQSVILTEASADAFRASWSLPASVVIVGGLSGGFNLGRNDEINLFNAADDLIDRLTYGDQSFPGSIRTQGRSGNPLTDAALGANDPFQWALASVGDVYGSFANSGGAIGNPGMYIPAPGAAALLGVAGLLAMRRRRD